MLARAYERRNAPATARAPRHQGRPQPLPPAAVGPVHALVTTQELAIAPVAPPPPRPFKKLSPDEMAERRRQGLCYNCDEPYVRGHKCARLFYLEVSDFDTDDAASAYE